ncbi:hypothetical protein SmJEL517_g01034 [Synchytrium microbalum]|uniref:TRP C-terminal domain-containing protein n=1 Tax=Synchytrium microbalum TaxID=1806994 RepID=A0A507CHI2_9FUNG|nr:uncharacterized protein SmJEL517_g01034 [Synchytrium microbalum]TPX37145.1 hypothetical protein SmJEL517_g01034 [Synchytrium microbalum]
MGVVDIFQILVTFAQHLSIISSFNIPWPAQWNGFLAVKNLRLDLSVQFTTYVPAIDFRAQYIILAYFIPMFITLFMLIFFKSPQVVVWYGLLLGCFGCLAAGIALQFIPTTQYSSQQNIASILMSAGGGGAGFLLVVYLIIWAVRRHLAKRKKARIHAASSGHPNVADILNARSVSTVALSNEIKPNLKLLASGSHYKMKPWWKILRNMIVAGALLYSGLLLVGATSNPYTSDYLSQVEGQQIQPIAIALGTILLVFGTLLSYNIISGFFLAGRKMNKRMNSFFRKNMTQFALLGMVILYIPQTTAVFNVFPCTQITCSAGQQFVTNRIDLDITSISSTFLRNTTNSTACTACTFQSTCPANVAAQLCPSVSDLRLNKDPSLSCISEVYPFYLPGAVLVVISATLGFPWLIHTLVSVVSQFLKDIPPLGATTQAESWLIHGSLSQNSCKSLYFGYHYKWRYYNLNVVVQKFLVVAVFVFSVYHEIAIATVIACIHCFFFITALYSRPYVNITETVLSIACVGLNAANSVLAVLVAFQLNVPPNTIYAVATGNLAIPILCIVVGSYFEARLQKRIIESQKARIGGAPANKVQLAKDRGRRVHADPGQDEALPSFMASRKVPSKGAKGKANVSNQHHQHAAIATRGYEEQGGYDGDNLDRESEESEDEYEYEDHRQDKKTLKDKKKKKKPEMTPEEKRLVELVKRLDGQLNVFLLRVLVQFFLVMGLAVFLGLCMTGIGIIRIASDSDVVGATSYAELSNTSATNFEFAGYASWSDFTSNCCCSTTTSSYTNTSTSLYEMWKCLPNSYSGSSLFYKKRKRSDTFVGSGIVLRDYCSTTFNPAVVCGGPTLNVNGSVAVTLCSGVTLAAGQTALYW